MTKKNSGKSIWKQFARLTKKASSGRMTPADMTKARAVLAQLEKRAELTQANPHRRARGMEALPAGRTIRATVRKVKRGGRYVLEIQRLASPAKRKRNPSKRKAARRRILRGGRR